MQDAVQVYTEIDPLQNPVEHAMAFMNMLQVQKEKRRIEYRMDYWKCGYCGERKLTFDDKMGDAICISCGFCITQSTFEDIPQKLQYKDWSRCNKKPVHHFHPYEHFSRYMGDITGSNRRRIPVGLITHMKYKKGPITPEDVYQEIKKLGKPSWYVFRWHVAYMINGRTPFHFSEKLRQDMLQYFRMIWPTILQYQQDYLGITGKNRVFCPYRFLFKKVCEHFDQKELQAVIPETKSVKLEEFYETHWSNIMRRL